MVVGRPTFQDPGLSIPVRNKCTRIKRNGDRCGNWPVNGATVCRFHGAAKGTPARAKAEEQLKKARDSLMAALLKIAHDEKVSTADRLKAITWALERSGFRAGVEVTVGLKPWQELLSELDGTGGTAALEHRPPRELPAGPPPDAPDAVVEGEIVGGP